MEFSSHLLSLLLIQVAGILLLIPATYQYILGPMTIGSVTSCHPPDNKDNWGMGLLASCAQKYGLLRGNVTVMMMMMMMMTVAIIMMMMMIAHWHLIAESVRSIMFKVFAAFDNHRAHADKGSPMKKKKKYAFI